MKLVLGSGYSTVTAVASMQLNKTVSHTRDKSGMSNDAISASNVSDYWKKKFGALEALPKNSHGKPIIGKVTYKQSRQIRCVWGFLFGPFYYIRLGMYQKAAILFAIFALMIAIVSIVEASSGIILPDSINYALSVPIPFYCLYYVSLDYYKFVHYGDKFWGPTWLRSNRAVAAVTGASVLIAITTLAVFNAPEDILADVSGVWRDDANEVVTVDLSGRQKSISTHGSKSSCQFKKADTDNNIVVLNCSRKDGGSAIVAIRKIFRKDGSYTIGISVDDSPEQALSYVRPI